MAVSAGELRERVDVLALVETADGFAWEAVRRISARVEETGKNCLFSSAGKGAPGVALTLRRQTLDRHNALLWRGWHLCLASCITEGGWLTVEAAMVEVVPCVGRRFTAGLGAGNRPQRVEAPPLSFSGILMEKYLGYELGETRAVATRTLVLVTQREILLDEGDLVQVGGGGGAGTYNVTACHLLDAYRSEYEMTKKKDV